MSEWPPLYIFTGLPGSGKTYVANEAAELTDGRNLSSGDIIRELAVSQGLNDISSDQLGEFAAGMREREGHDFVAKKAVTMFENGGLAMSDPMFIDGIRHADEVAVLDEAFDTTTVVWVAAPGPTRLERIQEREREAEGDFEKDDLKYRDQRELHRLGLQTLLGQKLIDQRIDNAHDESNIHEQLSQLLFDKAGAEI
jgi:dephospho-CoA kinase